jgi:CheY-like chemotaxis protein
MYRSVYRHYLSRHGYEVEVAEGGVHCLEKLEQFQPDVLILDLNLPWGGGEGVLAVMRDRAHLCRIPVLLTSTVARPEALARLVSPPLVRVLNKPGSLLVLCQQVDAASGKKPALSKSGRGEPAAWKDCFC